MKPQEHSTALDKAAANENKERRMAVSPGEISGMAAGAE
jgi:hypothetical protein